MSIDTVARPKGAAMAWTGGVLLLLGLVVVAFSLVRLISGSGVIDTLTTPVSDVVNGSPETITRTLEPGGYAVYALAVPGGVTTPVDVVVTGPDGPVPVGTPGGNQTVTRGSTSFLAVADFEVTRAGSYQVQVTAQTDTKVLLAPSLTSAVTRAAGWVGGIILGALLGLVGLTLLVVGLVRRMRRPATAAPGYPGSLGGGDGAPVPPGYPTPAPSVPATPVPQQPAGWYPDTERPGGQRYWDGLAWTEHRA